MTKVTFTLDDRTVQTIRMLAERQRKPRSLVVREAVAAYATHEERLSEAERTRRLRLIDSLASKPRTRAQAGVAAELRELRRARRAGWRRPAD